MHFHYLSLLALSTGALSLPSLSPATSSLEKRSSYGWIGSFGVNDNTCGQNVIGPRPELERGGCTEWSNSSPRAGIDWGAGEPQFWELSYYSDSKCSDTAYLGSVKRIGGEPGHCALIDITTNTICKGSNVDGGPCHINGVIARASAS